MKSTSSDFWRPLVGVLRNITVAWPGRKLVAIVTLAGLAVSATVAQDSAKGPVRDISGFARSDRTLWQGSTLPPEPNKEQCYGNCDNQFAIGTAACIASAGFCTVGAAFCLAGCMAVVYGYDLACENDCDSQYGGSEDVKLAGPFITYEPSGTTTFAAGRVSTLDRGLFLPGQGTVTQVSFYLLDADSIPPERDGKLPVPILALPWTPIGQGVFDGNRLWTVSVDMSHYQAPNGYVTRVDFDDSVYGLQRALGIALPIETTESTTLFSDLGPAGSLYQCCAGLPITGNQTPGGTSYTQANLFTSLASGSVSQIDLAVGYVSGTNAFFASVFTDNNGLPGTQLYRIDNLSSSQRFGQCCGLVTITGITGLDLTAGQQYFVVLGPETLTSTTSEQWNLNNQGVNGLELYSTNGGQSWISNGTGNPLGAFDVIGASNGRSMVSKAGK